MGEQWCKSRKKNGSRKIPLHVLCWGLLLAILLGFEKIFRLLPDVFQCEHFWHSVSMGNWKEKMAVLKTSAFKFVWMLLKLHVSFSHADRNVNFHCGKAWLCFQARKFCYNKFSDLYHPKIDILFKGLIILLEMNWYKGSKLMVFYQYINCIQCIVHSQYVETIEINVFTECLLRGISACSQNTTIYNLSKDNSPPAVTLHLQRRVFLFKNRSPHVNAYESWHQNLQ